MNCARCGARLQQGMLICPECGTRQRRQARWVRCAACHRRVPVQLTVCPHCGRSVHPAGPRWGVWLVGIVLIAMLGAWGVRRLPVARAWQRVVAVEEQFATLIALPELPAAEPAATATVQRPVVAVDFQGQAGQPVPSTAATEGVSVVETPAAEPSTPAPAAVTSEPSPAAATAAPTGTAQATATAQPTATPPLSATPPPAATAAPTATPEANKYYTVQQGDSLALIGEKTGIDWRQIAAANNVNQNTMLHPGDQLVLPSGSSGPAAATAPSRARKYTVQAGDSLAAIGQKLGLDWQDIARANGLNQNSMLMPGQELTIPGG